MTSIFKKMVRGSLALNRAAGFALSFVVMFSSEAVFATVYYVDSAGNDQNPGTSTSAPWKSLDKVSLMKFNPGDQVLFKRGENFKGSLKINSSGTATSPIVFGAYGTGSNPVLHGFATLGNWVSKGNGIYEASCGSDSNVVNMVTINDAVQPMGRWPNADQPNKGYRTITSHDRIYSISDSSLSSTPNWTGGEVVIRHNHWTLDRWKITSHVGTRISFESVLSLSDEPKDGYGYFIQNHIQTLDQFGEWYFNPTTRTLSMYFGSSSPTAYVIKASVVSNIIMANNRDYLRFENLNIQGAIAYGISAFSSHNMTVSGCQFSKIGDIGISMSDNTYNTIENCEFSYAHSYGIRGNSLAASHNTVRNNIFKNIGNFAGMGLGRPQSYSSLRLEGDYNLIQGNQIFDSGFMGILFNGNYVTIEKNYINKFAFVKDDAGGIYTGNSYGNTEKVGRKIRDNIILNGVGAVEGTPHASWALAGIYMDDGTCGVEITGNTAANTIENTMLMGVYIHNAFNITVKDNLLYNNRNQIYMNNDDLTTHVVRNVAVSNNVFFSRHPSQTILQQKSTDNDLPLFGTMGGNCYARPIGDNFGIITTFKNGTTFVPNVWDLPGYKSFLGKEGGATSAALLTPYKIISVVGANHIVNGNFATNVTGFVYQKAVVSRDTTKLDAGCLKVITTNETAYLSFKVGAVTQGKRYQLKYSMLGTADNNLYMKTFLRQSASPYTKISSDFYCNVRSTRTENTVLFSPNASDSAAALIFTLGNARTGTFYLDNIQFYEVGAVMTNPDDVFRFEYNPTATATNIALDGVYKDARGNSYSTSVTLNPYRSIVLIKDPNSVTAVNIPVISSASAVTAIKDQPFTYQITASNTPTSYNATGLPSGLNVNTSTGSISGTPTVTGVYNVTLSATNAGGTGTKVLTITLNSIPTIAGQPVSKSVTEGQTATFSVAATGSPSPSYQWMKNGTAIIGATSSSYTTPATVLSDSGAQYSVVVSNVAGSVTSSAATLTVTPANVAPSITSQPASKTVTAGQTATFSVTATGTPAPNYQWMKNGVAITGATSSSYTTAATTTADNGAVYKVTVSNVAGTVTSGSATLTVSAPNVSPNANAGTDKTITLPTSSVALTGSGTDTDGTIASYTWSQVSGPNTATISSASTASTTISGLVKGSYVFRLKVTDNAGASATDDVTVTVNSIRQFLVDFGSSSIQSSPNWNNLTSGATGAGITALMDKTGKTSGIGLTIVDGFWQQTIGFANKNGTKSSMLYPDTATSDSFFVGTLNGVTDNLAQVRLSGLSSTATYKIRLYASRSTTDLVTDRTTIYTINGVSKELQVRNNIDGFVEFDGLKAVNGQIDLSIAKKAGALFGYLGVLDVTETSN